MSELEKEKLEVLKSINGKLEKQENEREIEKVASNLSLSAVLMFLGFTIFFGSIYLFNVTEYGFFQLFKFTSIIFFILGLILIPKQKK